MLKTVEISPNGFCCHHNFIKTKRPGKFISNSNKEFKAFVIDGYCLESLIDEQKFISKDIEKFYDFILKWLDTENNDSKRKFLGFLTHLAATLQRLIILKKDLLQNDLRKEFIYEVYKRSSKVDVENFSNKNIYGYVNGFYEQIKGNPNINDVKNLLEPVFEIFKLSHQFELNLTDAILPFEIKNKELIYRSLKMKLSEGIPLIIIDPYTPDDVYKQIFAMKKIQVFDIINEFPSLNQTPNNLKIYQLDRGYYPKKSFAYPKTQELIFSIVSKYLKNKGNTKHIIYISKEFMEKLNNYLYNKNKNYELHYFYDAISKGTSSLQDFDEMIIVGDVEPNPNDLIKQIEMFHIGEEPLNLFFNKKTRKFDDNRIQIFYNIKNNEEIRNIIYRIRPFTSISQKTVLLLSKIAIKDKTEQISLDELQFRLRNKNMNLSSKAVLSRIKDGQMIAKRVKSVVKGIHRKRIAFSTIVQRVKGTGKFSQINTKVIEKIIKLTNSTMGKTVIKN